MVSPFVTMFSEPVSEELQKQLPTASPGKVYAGAADVEKTHLGIKVLFNNNLDMLLNNILNNMLLSMFSNVYDNI